MYKDDGKKLAVLTLDEANKLSDILKKYPTVFTEIEVIPRGQDEIVLLDISYTEANKNLSFDFEEVVDDCKEIINLLEDTFDNRICGIDREETKRQLFENK
jgi:hypothetical protein